MGRDHLAAAPGPSIASSRSWTRSCATASVEIVESTAARVHVRWSYQSTDFHYKVWGDEAVEDYYFYPDGFGTRVVNLKADPKNDYELSEFIILTPQGAYPFEVLPDDPVDALFLDGRKHRFPIPEPDRRTRLEAGQPPEDGSAGNLPPATQQAGSALGGLLQPERDPSCRRSSSRPFFDAGQMVTPCYWGSHWPLARGNSTGQRRSTTGSSSRRATTA